MFQPFALACHSHSANAPQAPVATRSGQDEKRRTSRTRTNAANNSPHIQAIRSGRQMKGWRGANIQSSKSMRWATFYSFLELRPATRGVLGLPLLAIELGDQQFLNGPGVKAPSVDTEAVRV